MKFRCARHCNDLEKLVDFYTEIVGLEVLGRFDAHDGYDGAFLGLRGSDWHLEFTASGTAADHQTDADDLLVFYLPTAAAWAKKRAFLAERGIKLVTSQNPYWRTNGLEIADPEGFGIVFAVAPNRTTTTV